MNQDSGSPYDDAVNPYAVDVTASIGNRPTRDRGLIPQLVPLGICMIVQGVLEGLLGVCMAVLAFVFPAIAARQGNQLPPNMQPMMQALYSIIGFALVLVSALHIFAGIKIMRYEGRVLAFAALGSGFLTLLGCYCLPTAVALFVWGMVVLLNNSVQTAFRLRAEGHTKHDIDRMLD